MIRNCTRCHRIIQGRPPQATLCFPCVPLNKKEQKKKENDKRPRKGWAPKSSQSTKSTYFVNNRSYIEQLIDRIDAIDAELSR